MRLFNIINEILANPKYDNYVIYSADKPCLYHLTAFPPQKDSEQENNYKAAYGTNEFVIYNDKGRICYYGINPMAKEDIPSLQNFGMDGTFTEILTALKQIYNPQKIIVTDNRKGINWRLSVITSKAVLSAFTLLSTQIYHMENCAILDNNLTKIFTFEEEL